MTRPNYIRADTIDLQDSESPSAKDHSRQPARPAALGEGPPAPHQANALRHVELEISEQHGRSPRASQDLSGKELQLLHDEADQYGDHDPSENLLRNSSQHASQEDLDEGDGDDSLDDDLADKISSSPSIGDDGGYPIPYLPWPSRVASLPSVSTSENKMALAPGPPSDVSSSPFSETPEHLPLSYFQNNPLDTPSKDHHHQGEYAMDQRTPRPRRSLLVDEYDVEKRDRLKSLIDGNENAKPDNQLAEFQRPHDDGFDPRDFQHLLAPEHDPLLDKRLDDEALGSVEQEQASQSSSPASSSSWTTDIMEGPDDDDTEDISYNDDSRFIDSGWGGECLRETEDIDFEFVYALHTFVATVEGQANATKGDTMTLLDDSNSYWWLVRVVKDSSIGYLPAEHIETPLERLARLNKHRNADLSQTMLTDQDEDKRQNPLSPLKKAIRRRNVKKVEFAGNSYVEPSDAEYTSEEEEEEEDTGEFGVQEQNGSEDQRHDHTRDTVDNAAVAPLTSRDRAVNGRRPDDVTMDPETRNELDHNEDGDQTRTSEEVLDHNDDGTVSKSRKGTVRNTDSFFKDESLETRRINLTPSLLRDDSNPMSPRASESSELKSRTSLDSLEKDTPPERLKDEKKKKEKRGMLGGMFKRKDKKTKGQDKDVDDNEKHGHDLLRKSPTPKESMESIDAKNTPQPHRQTSKLQKQPPAKISPKSSYTSQVQAPNQSQKPASLEQQKQTPSGTDQGPPPAALQNGTMRLVIPEPKPLFDDSPSRMQFIGAEGAREVETRQEPVGIVEVPKDQSTVSNSPWVNALKPTPSQPNSQTANNIQDHLRTDDLADSSSSSLEQGTEPYSARDIHDEPPQDARSPPVDHHLAIAQAAQHEQNLPALRSATSGPTILPSETPTQPPSSTTQEQTIPQQPPPLLTDTSSPSTSSSPHSPLSPASSTSESANPSTTATAMTTTTTATYPSKPPIITSTTSNRGLGSTTPSASPATQPSPSTSSSPSTGSTSKTNTPTTRSTPTWSDASLRAYMDDDNTEIRDLLIVINDKSGVVGRRDHPVVQELFRVEREELKEVERRLDALLESVLARRR